MQCRCRAARRYIGDLRGVNLIEGDDVKHGICRFGLSLRRVYVLCNVGAGEGRGGKINNGTGDDDGNHGGVIDIEQRTWAMAKRQWERERERGLEGASSCACDA